MDNKITSDTLIPIEQHFRVSAGPGAGKTHWLINHIFNVLQKSNRLGKTRKIACITYTNVAVSTILERLTTSSDKVEVCTIHSFLYKHVVKPYVHFIADEYGLDALKMDGHDDIIISRNSIINWINNHPNNNLLSHPFSIKQLTLFPQNTYALSNWLETLRFKFNSKNLFLDADNQKAKYTDNGNETRINKKCLDILKQDLFGFKKNYWSEGILHHDDVLFFSYQLLIKYPFILNVLRAKFPYFFIDEFQDSNPIQVEIIKQIGQLETIIGVIGDKAQSIYGFQGADVKQFDKFRIKNITDYNMLDNRRSTNQIINTLNLIRLDFQQNNFLDIEGEQPMIIVGEAIKSYRDARKLLNNEELYSLSYANIMSNIMKKEILEDKIDSKLLSSLKYKDSNDKRYNVISFCIQAVELSIQHRFKEAIKLLSKIFKDKKIALEKLRILMNSYKDYCDGSMFSFANFINNNISKISSFKKGNIKEFYENHTYKSLALCVNIIEDDSIHRTIHKAKGAEFDNVMLILDSEEKIDFLLSPDLENEEHRVYYVALSRAKKRLFICVPALNELRATQLENIKFKILRNEVL